ncbi:MAG: hypothetical protein AAF542_19380 [Pseudomonadota bacterium]
MSWMPSSETTLTLKQLGVDVDHAVQLFNKTTSIPSDQTFKTFAVSQTHQKKEVSISLSWRPSKGTRQRLDEQGYPKSVVEDLLLSFLLLVREGQPVTNLDRSFERYLANRYVLPNSTDPLLTASVEQHLIYHGFSRQGIKNLAKRYLETMNDQKSHNDFINYALGFNPVLTDSLFS